jgi:hypothetical protein
MSRRTSIVKALAEKFKEINGTGIYKTNLYGAAFPFLKFWDEVNSFPCLYMSTGSEQREYLPGNFTWAYLGISIKVYCKNSDDPQEELELLLEDVEKVINNNRQIVYDTINGYDTTEILIASIVTDESLLKPYGIGEIQIQVRYQYPT